MPGPPPPAVHLPPEQTQLARHLGVTRLAPPRAHGAAVASRRPLQPRGARKHGADLAHARPQLLRGRGGGARALDARVVTVFALVGPVVVPAAAGARGAALARHLNRVRAVRRRTAEAARGHDARKAGGDRTRILPRRVHPGLTAVPVIAVLVLAALADVRTR